MAMFKWSGIYINPQDVAAIYTDTDSTKPLPFYMTVHLRDGKEYRMNYAKESARDADANRLASQVNRFMPEPVTRSEIEELMDKMKGAVRRDIKALQLEITKGENHGDCYFEHLLGDLSVPRRDLLA